MTRRLEVHAIEGIDHEIILEIDFCKQWELEIQFANKLWRVLRGEFRENSDCSADDAPVMMEYASIAKIAEVEREREREREREGERERERRVYGD